MNTNLIKQSNILTAVLDNTTGEVGFKAEGVPTIDSPMVALEGNLIAHDILEHLNGLESIGTISDELLALGGVWFVRGQHADITRKPTIHSPLEHLSAELVDMGVIYCRNESIKVTRGSARIDEEMCGDYDIAETALELIDLVEPQIKKELMGEYCKERLAHYLDCAFHLMCQGYEKAEERFKGCEVYANSMFWKIAEAFDNALEYCDVMEGAQIKLEWCFQSGEVTARALEFYEIEGYATYEEYEEAVY